MERPIAVAPDVVGLEVPKDDWTQPFWDAAEQGVLLVPHCADCGHFRWPPGPFCPRCQSQRSSWSPPGKGRIYSFTIIGDRTGSDAQVFHVPALIEFPDAEGIRIVAAIAESPIDQIRIGEAVSLTWSTAHNARIPVFRVDGEREVGRPPPV